MFLLQKEFLAAVCMSFLTAFFAWDLGNLSGEAKTMPMMLIIVMAAINILQYVMSFWHGLKGARLNIKNYPFILVGKLFLLSVIYIATLLWLGFYIGSFLYLFLGAFIAMPEKGGKWKIILLLIGCALFIFGLYALFTMGLGVQIPLGSLWK